MDQRAWLWKKKSSEKIIVANGKADLQLKENAEEVQLPNEKEVALEKSVKILNDRITSLLDECNDREEELVGQAKIAQEAMEGKEKAEAELLVLRKDLEEALQEKLAANERISSLNAALKECMQQLNSNREEREQRVQDAIMRASEELEMARHRLEENLSESSKRIANLNVENAHLSKTLMAKEALIEELTNQRSQLAAEFDALMSRLDSVEKENAFLRYEHRVLEKDLEVRNEEIEFCRRSTESSEKQQLESVKKIKRLEAECQRLRVLVRKRIPGPFALANIKPEVEVQGRYNTETRRKKLNFKGGEDPDISNKRINFLVERLQSVEQENKSLRDVLANKEKDICHSSAASNVGIETEDHRKPVELTLPGTLLNELSTISSFESGEEAGSNCSRSRASAVMGELQNYKDGDFKSIPEHHMIENSEMSLMDDFIEMEKLAIVAVDTPSEKSHALPDSSSKSDSCLNDMDSAGKELVPIGNGDLNNMNQGLQMNDTSSRKRTDWLQTVVKMITEQVCVSGRSIDELLEDIRLVFQCEGQRGRPSPDSRQNQLSPISCHITWKSPATSPGVDSIDRDLKICSSREENYHESDQCVSSSIGKIIGLIRRFDSSTKDSTLSSNQLTSDEDYAILVFGWKNHELTTVIHQFIQTCDLLLSGKIGFEKFTAELSSTLEWILEKSIKNQHNSTARNEFKNYFDKNGSRTCTESESMQKFMMEMEKILSVLEVENSGLKAELTSLKSLQKDVEQRSLQSAEDSNKALRNELQQSLERTRSFQAELDAVRESKRLIEDQYENLKLINEDLDTQLTVARVKLNEVSQKLSSLEGQLEDKNHCCEELEGTCLELQLQLESKGTLKDEKNQEEKLLHTGWEIKAASAKLAECEATILNLGNQLKALTSPKESSNPNKVVYNHRKSRQLNQRFSLLDQMLTEDDAGTEVMTREVRGTTDSNIQSAIHDSSVTAGAHIGPKDKEEAKTALKNRALVVVPSKKKGGGFSFLTKMLFRRKTRSTHKTFFPFSP